MLVTVFQNSLILFQKNIVKLKNKIMILQYNILCGKAIIF